MIIAEGSGQTLMVTPASIAPFTFDESAAVFLTNLFRANYGIGAASASPQPSRPDTRPPTAGCAVRTPCLHLLP